MTPESPPSLSQLFEPAEGYVGAAALVCGFRADAPFMDACVERFTRLTADQRGIEARIRVGLIVDPRNPQIFPDAVPGMLQLLVKADHAPFRLLHAKVALLLFRPIERAEAQHWVLRLIVSTGNWTRETADRAIDLFWCVELHDSESEGDAEPRTQIISDMLATAEFFDAVLRDCVGYDLNSLPDPLQPLEELSNVLAQIRSVGGNEVIPRFIHNLRTPLFEQVIERATPSGGASKSNYLAIGSGFFDGPLKSLDDGNDEHAVERVRRRLIDDGVLTKKPTLELFVNLEACQGVKQAAAVLRERGWKIYRASYLDQASTQRFLHAKFIFGACMDAEFTKASRGWVYLGSGNITRNGFFLSAGRGNLEAGVVLRPGTLYLKRRSSGPRRSANYLLPIACVDDEITSDDALAAGDAFEMPPVVCTAVPIMYFRWASSGDEAWLAPFPLLDAGIPVRVNGPDGRDCERIDTGFRWLGGEPRQVSVRVSDGLAVIVPVIGKDGRVAAAPSRPCSIADLWSQLEGFPEPPAIDEDEDEFGSDGDRFEETMVEASRPRVAMHSTLIRETMDLLEQIAERQMEVQLRDWDAWCARLQQTLIRAAGTEEVRGLHALGVNPLAPLRDAAFRPAFAQSGTRGGALYESTLSEIELEWQVNGLRPIGRAA